jgi:cob(I)alamin adenosyltransferase
MSDTFKEGLVQIYTGNGKGKTTAALGQVFRAAGHGLKSYVIQFMKGNIEYGELETARRTGELITIVQMGRETFVSRENPDPIDIKWAQKGLDLAYEIVTGGKYDIVVLDELNVALDFGLLGEKEVLKLLEKKPAHVELIITGRYAPRSVLDRADLITEMVEVKHWFQNGHELRVGIER